MQTTNFIKMLDKEYKSKNRNKDDARVYGLRSWNNEDSVIQRRREGSGKSGYIRTSRTQFETPLSYLLKNQVNMSRISNKESEVQERIMD